MNSNFQKFCFWRDLKTEDQKWLRKRLLNKCICIKCKLDQAVLTESLYVGMVLMIFRFHTGLSIFSNATVALQQFGMKLTEFQTKPIAT